jgi:hypothetical protein
LQTGSCSQILIVRRASPPIEVPADTQDAKERNISESGEKDKTDGSDSSGRGIGGMRIAEKDYRRANLHWAVYCNSHLVWENLRRILNWPSESGSESLEIEERLRSVDDSNVLQAITRCEIASTDCPQYLVRENLRFTVKTPYRPRLGRSPRQFELKTY